MTPTEVWKYFYEICNIPRPSKNETKIRQYLLEFAANHSISTKTDKAGNLLLTKPATKGMENRKTVILQSHLDMVCEKNNGVSHDFDNEPIRPYIEGEWMKAHGTTLGADDGIGIAASMAILASNEIKHGPVECLFTVDEESGLSGANELEPDFMKGKILLNLDSEDEGEIFIGCAGGIDTIVSLKCKRDSIPSGHLACEITVKGLKGGHSGDEIHLNTGNSNILLSRILWHATGLFKIRLARFEGGNLRNAIPREASAIFTVKAEKLKQLKSWFAEYSQTLKNEYCDKEPKLNLLLKRSEIPDSVFRKTSQQQILNSIYICPNGVIEWSRDIEGLVETSTNLASVKPYEVNNIQIITSQRSSVETAKIEIASKIRAVFELAGAEVTHSTGYPGWKPDKSSKILSIATDAYEKIFGVSPKVKAIHAGLECGLFLEKYPYLDMISFGPTIKGAHSPDERIHIGSTQKFWDLLIGILENIPEQGN